MFEINTLLDYQPLSIVIDYYGLLLIVINFCQSIKVDNFFLCEFDSDRLPISIDSNRWLISIDIECIDWFPISISIDWLRLVRRMFQFHDYSWTHCTGHFPLADLDQDRWSKITQIIVHHLGTDESIRGEVWVSHIHLMIVNTVWWITGCHFAWLSCMRVWQYLFNIILGKRLTL